MRLLSSLCLVFSRLGRAPDDGGFDPVEDGRRSGLFVGQSDALEVSQTGFGVVDERDDGTGLGRSEVGLLKAAPDGLGGHCGNELGKGDFDWLKGEKERLIERLCLSALPSRFV